MLTGVIVLGLLIRLCISLHPYSGQNTPPMFGDFEAQRHWMEITYNLPLKDWYFNTLDNDLMYWGLDYPPLTAYHSWVCGYVASSFNSSFVKLKESRGLESESIKVFMRCTVLIADLMTFVPSLILFYLQTQNINAQKAKECSVSTNEIMKLCCLLSLIYPGIILIDHGHFQYNCVSLGLFVFAVTAISKEQYVMASILFCLALLYKQMELYHALPFFFYLLNICVSDLKKDGFVQAFMKLSHIGGAVCFTLILVCLPFITSLEGAIQLLVRLFPIARGVFEDKVANVWCVINIFYKLRLLVSNEDMAKICLFSTCVAVIPSLYNTFTNKSYLKFKYSLVNSALSFFLFSYQVHEKTILLVAVPVLLIMPLDPFACNWFLHISVFSMFPLLLKDKLLIPYIALSFLFMLIYESSSLKNLKVDDKATINYFTFLQFFTRHITLLYYVSLFGCLVLNLAHCLIRPPKKYPDIFPLLISAYSCLHFVGFLIYFNIKQWTVKETKNRHKFD